MNRIETREFELMAAGYEKEIGMDVLKENARAAFRETGGKRGREWLACNAKWMGEEYPERLLPTEHRQIAYWVNYGDGDTYGWFSVEQIKEWLTNPDVKLHELGGHKESRTTTNK